MKGKAITKIVICSIVAVLLTGILLAGVLGIEVFRALPGIREFKEETGRFFIDLDKYDNENSYNIGSAELDSVVSRSTVSYTHLVMSPPPQGRCRRPSA